MTTPSAVLIPGTLCDARLFDPMLARLDVRPVHAPPIARADVKTEAAAVLALSPSRFVAVGFSLGAFVVLELLRQAPDRIIGAVLLSGNAHPAADGLAPARRAEVALARAEGVTAVIDRLWPSYVARAALDRDDLRTKVKAMAEAVGVERFAQQAEMAVSRPDSRSTIEASDVPVLVVHGDEDAMIPPERFIAAASGLRGSRVPLEGVGHFLPLEAPEAAATAVRTWLGGLAA